MSDSGPKKSWSTSTVNIEENLCCFNYAVKIQKLPSSSMEKSVLRSSNGVPGYAGGGSRRCCWLESKDLDPLSKDRFSLLSSTIDMRSIRLMRGSNWPDPDWIMLRSECCCCCCCCCWGTTATCSCWLQFAVLRQTSNCEYIRSPP